MIFPPGSQTFIKCPCRSKHRYSFWNVSKWAWLVIKARAMLGHQTYGDQNPNKESDANWPLGFKQLGLNGVLQLEQSSYTNIWIWYLRNRWAKLINHVNNFQKILTIVKLAWVFPFQNQRLFQDGNNRVFFQGFKSRQGSLVTVSLEEERLVKGGIQRSLIMAYNKKYIETHSRLKTEVSQNRTFATYSAFWLFNSVMIF